MQSLLFIFAGTARSSGAQLTALLLKPEKAPPRSNPLTRHLSQADTVSEPSLPSETPKPLSFFGKELHSLGVTSVNWASDEMFDLAAKNDVILVTSAYAGPWVDGLLTAQPQMGGRIAWWFVEGRKAEFDIAKGGLVRMLTGEEKEGGSCMFVNAVQAQKWHGWLRNEVIEVEEEQRIAAQKVQAVGVNRDDQPGNAAEEGGVHTRVVRREAGERRKLVGLGGKATGTLEESPRITEHISLVRRLRPDRVGGKSSRRQLLQGDPLVQIGGLRGASRLDPGLGKASSGNKVTHVEERSANAEKQSAQSLSPAVLARLTAALNKDPHWYSIVPMTLDRNVLLAAGLAEPGQINENSVATAKQHRGYLRRYYRRDVLHVWDDEFLAVVVGGFNEEEGHMLTLEAINQLVASLSQSDDDDEAQDPDREFNLFDKDPIWGGIDGLQGVPGVKPLTAGREDVESEEEEEKVGIGSSNNQIVGRSFGMEVQDDRKRVQGGGAAERSLGGGEIRTENGRVVETGLELRAARVERGTDSALKNEEADDSAVLDAHTRAAETRAALERAGAGKEEGFGGGGKGPFEDLTLAEQMDDKKRFRRLLGAGDETSAVSPSHINRGLSRSHLILPRAAEPNLDSVGRPSLKKRVSRTRSLLQEDESSPEITLRILFLATDPLPLTRECYQHLEEMRGYLKQNPRLRTVVSIGHYDHFQASGVYASADAFIMNRQVDGNAVHGKLLQAMAYGLPILSTEVLPAAGLLVDGDNAILHDVGISGASKMVTDLKNVMQNTEAMKQHGDRAARLIEAEYMESVMFEVLGRTLSELQQSR